MRVPIPTGSVTDLTVTVSRDTTAAEVNAAFKAAAEGPLKGILQYTEEELVSVDYTGNPHSCIYDSKTTTGAAKATSLVIPELKGKIDGISIRVPTPDVSLVDLAVVVDKPVTVEQVNAAFKAAAEGDLSGILQYTEEELVSSDYIGNAHSCILDSKCTSVVDGLLLKVSGWYDNEWGYASRCVDLTRFVAARL
jgi:glyceraldehyde-3-phosphate dehydrogenase/erythrose-4-phosphate dehydrogenase